MAKKQLSLAQALAEYDLKSSVQHVQEGERERQEILKRFPIEDWPQLPLERFALGLPNSVDNYCRWLEFGTPHLGSMRGGSAVKHIIYKHKNQPGWYYNTALYSSEGEAWTALRGVFVQMFDLAAAEKWDEIDDPWAPLGGRTMRLKTLSVYFPNGVLPITSHDHLLHFLRATGAFSEEMKNWEVVRLNRRLLEVLRGKSELAGWTTQQLERFLYWWSDPRETRRIVKIAPGEEGRYWEDCLANGYICVGWDAVGSLLDFETEDGFRERFDESFEQEYNNHRPTLTRKARELWTLAQLEPGDVVVANRGVSRVLAIGEVVEPAYAWLPERAEYRHVVKVRWDTSYAQDIQPQRGWATVTVAPVSVDLYQTLLKKPGKMTNNGLPPSAVEPRFLEIADALNRKGQAILFGPPGTGKTYYARRFAVWWLLQAEGKVDAASVLADEVAFSAAERRLTTVQMTRRVWWVVANPKEWGWETLLKKKRETFRYGRIQRNYPLAQPGDLVIGYQATPDKRVVALARVSKGTKEMGEAPGIELEALCEIKSGPTYDTLRADPVLGRSEPMRNRCQGTLFALTTEEADHLLALLSENNPDVSNYADTGGSIGSLTRITFHPSYSYEDFVEGFRPVDAGQGNLVLRLEDGIFKRICREAEVHPKQRYLLLVDEINRANIAKVFGELVTLLEKDKRGLTVALSQSKESFAIPPNVYLLGTMNTADRSIKLLDAALRRRFAFIEMMPDVSLLHGPAINGLLLDDFLEMLNRRIAEREGREKQIGHAFLLQDGQPISEPDEFARRFRQEILPLLQEYCYDDYEALVSYLGDKLVDAKGQSLNEETLNDSEKLIEALISAAQGKPN